MTGEQRTPRILVVAGSDSGGGAGIQADIKTVTMLGGHAMTAVTAITAQNTLGVQAMMPVPAEMVVAQMRSCIDDIGVDAVKIGMIGSAETANAVAGVLQALDVPIVFDPVMVATSGSTLADAETIATFDRLMTIASVVTPNIPELEALGGIKALNARGATVLAKGGHGGGDEIVDRLVGPDGEIARWSNPRINTPHTHGTGCTLASAISTWLGRGLALADATERAIAFVRIAMKSAPGLGGGAGPMGQGSVRDDGLLSGAMFNQVTLPAIDLEASGAFYESVGLHRIVDAPPRYARFESAGGGTVSIEAASEMDGKPVIYFECDDLDGVVARVRAAGVIVSEPKDQPWGWREAQTRDPAGNPVKLYQAVENRRFPPWRIGAIPPIAPR